MWGNTPAGLGYFRIPFARACRALSQLTTVEPLSSSPRHPRRTAVGADGMIGAIE